jgi:uncharacterized phage protein (TIGR01671 family)
MLVQQSAGVYETKRFLGFLYEDCELMQSTGLKDKNDVEIYEGDIVRLKSKKHGLHNATITYEAPMFIMDGNKSIFKDTALTISEVIGNIYENPELLESNDD